MAGFGLTLIKKYGGWGDNSKNTFMGGWVQRQKKNVDDGGHQNFLFVGGGPGKKVPPSPPHIIISGIALIWIEMLYAK